MIKGVYLGFGNGRVGKYTHDKIKGKQLKWISGRYALPPVQCTANRSLQKVYAPVETKLEVTLLQILTSKNIIMDL